MTCNVNFLTDPKGKIFELLNRFRNIRVQHVDELIGRFSSLINGSPLVSWHGRMFDDDYAFLSDKVVDNLYRIKSPAVKAYLWLLIRQEELARNTKGPGLNVSDSELGEGLGVTKRTARNYRETLSNLGLVESEQQKGSKSGGIAIIRVKY